MSPEIEPEPEIEFSAPPVPEQPFKPAPTFETPTPTAAPKIETPAKTETEIEFKTPDQILTGEVKKETSAPIFSAVSEESGSVCPCC